MYGLNGRDLVDGMAGNDTIYGFKGANKVRGHAGNDWITGGKGVDRVDWWDQCSSGSVLHSGSEPVLRCESIPFYS
jgi:Ca2+-binding RTX toxin-like protein